MRTAVMVAAVLLVVIGGSYGYLRYRLDQINTAKCPSCTAIVSGQPFNILIIGDDSRADNTPAENKNFGSDSSNSGAHSDTIKIAHVDPATGTASLLSIPRDTYVQLSGLSPQWVSLLGTRDQKINACLLYTSGHSPGVAGQLHGIPDPPAVALGRRDPRTLHVHLPERLP